MKHRTDSIYHTHRLGQGGRIRPNYSGTVAGNTGTTGSGTGGTGSTVGGGGAKW